MKNKINKQNRTKFTVTEPDGREWGRRLGEKRGRDQNVQVASYKNSDVHGKYTQGI